jgi:hypothetical protein
LNAETHGFFISFFHIGCLKKSQKLANRVLTAHAFAPRRYGLQLHDPT